MEFKQTSINDIKKFQSYFVNQKDRIFDFTGVGTYMWGKFFNQEYCIDEDILYLKYKIYDDKIAFNVPCSNASQRIKAYCKISTYCKENNLKLIFKEVTPESLEEISDIFPGYEAYADDDWAEYVYSIKDLATLEGKKFHKKRNHVNKFLQLYGNNFKLELLDKNNLEEVKKFQQSFIQNKENGEEISKIEIYENEAVFEVLDNIDRFPVIGYLLYVDNKLVAYTIGEVIDEMLFVHIEKAMTDIAGAYNIINKEFTKYISDNYPDVKFVNRSDDAGDAGLRQAKKSYNPIKMINKYIVEIDLKYGCNKTKEFV